MYKKHKMFLAFSLAVVFVLAIFLFFALNIFQNISYASSCCDNPPHETCINCHQYTTYFNCQDSAGCGWDFDIVNCPSGQVCRNNPWAQCVDCPSECAYGQIECVSDTSFRFCVSDDCGCRIWQEEECPSNTYCEYGYCEGGSNGNGGPFCHDRCTGGERRCVDITHFQVCADYDGDGCSEWPFSSISCPFSSCGAGHCSSDELGIWQCVLGFCNIEECVSDVSCCADECIEDERQCFGDIVQLCGNCDNDLCLEWCDGYDCSNGDTTTCGYGDCPSFYTASNWHCAVTGGSASCDYECIENLASCSNCADDCLSGETRCSGDIIQNCGQCDSDICLDWCNTVDCSNGNTTICGYGNCPSFYTASNWYCAVTGGSAGCDYYCIENPICQSCVDECSSGQTSCWGNIVQECYDCDIDRCLDWCPAEDCSNGDTTTCGYGKCLSIQTASKWYCAIIEGSASCDYACLENSSCQACTPECSSGDIRCFGDIAQDCGECDADACLDWCNIEDCSKKPNSCGYEICPDNQRPNWYCFFGNCYYNCRDDPDCIGNQDDCSPYGLTRCSDTIHQQTCDDCDSDPYLEWCNTILCEGDTSCGGETCSDTQIPIDWRCEDNACAYTCMYDSSCVGCTPECSSGDTRCLGNVSQNCSECDTDACLDWCDYEDCSQKSVQCGYQSCNDSQRPSWYCSGGICDYYCYWDPGCSCTSECSGGETRCVDNINYQSCGYYDSDVCLEWPTDPNDFQSCEGDVYCNYGTCLENQIPVWFCNNSTSSCDYTCTDDSSCISCTSECSSGQTRCFGDVVQNCEECDDDACLDWCYYEDCLQNPAECGDSSCLDNEMPVWSCLEGECFYDCIEDSSCISSCEDDCFPEGQTQCAGDNYEICVRDYDSDPCLEWSSGQSCVGDTSCGGGQGSYYCSWSERPQWFCDDSTGTCDFSCNYDQTCDNPGPGCIDECYTLGRTLCYDNLHKQTCDYYDADFCLEWGYDSCRSEVSCGYGKCEITEIPNWYCDSSIGDCDYNCISDMSCGFGCSDECSYWDQVRCFDNIIKQICGNWDADVCLEWSDQSCASDTSCGYGICADNQKPSWYCSQETCLYSCLNDSSCCVDECFSGQARCSDYTHEQTCGQYDSDDCLEWSFSRLCQGSTTCGYEDCSNSQRPSWYCLLGVCAYDCIDDSSCDDGSEPPEPCTNDCYSGEIRCYDSSNEQLCGYYDSDDCLDWSSPRRCQGSTTCGYGDCSDNEKPGWQCLAGSCTYSCVEDSNCRALCSNECSFYGQGECIGNNYKRICGNYDDDFCLEWSFQESCEIDITCGYRDCEDSQRPDWSCSNGECVYQCLYDSSCAVEPSCRNECPQRWLTRCVDDSHGQVCGIYWDDDECLEWGPSELCSGDMSCGYENCDEQQKPSWYCDESSDICDYRCIENSDCVSEYIKNFTKDCYDDDLYWFDTDGNRQEKAEECEDDNPNTIDGCEDRKCFNRTEEEEYCLTQEHCGDGSCNCDEDVYSCFKDCEFANLQISVFAKKNSDKEWKDKLTVSPNDKIDIRFIVSNNSLDDFDNIIIRAGIPQEMIYKEGLKVGDTSSKEDVRQGINIGFVSSKAEREVDFKAQIFSKADVGSEARITALLEVEDIYASDFLDLTIEKSKLGFWGVLKWLITRWYLWLLFWLLFVIILFIILKRRSREEEEVEEDFEEEII